MSEASNINIIVNGASGKMGRTSIATISNEKEFNLVATLGRHDDLISEIKKHKADVVIDLTTPNSVFDNTQKIIASGARAVIGTTGLTQDHIAILSKHCDEKKIGCVIAPNFSIGAILMMKYAQDAAKYFSDVEIIEYHHPQKKDAPSGTAKKTAELISQIKKAKNTSAPIDEKLKNHAARGTHYQDIPIHAVRLTGVFANQEVIFGNHNETFTLQHIASNRNAMMPGLLLCCRKVMQLNKLVYGMENIL